MKKVGPLTFRMGDFSIVRVHGRSMVQFVPSVNWSCVKCILENVLYVPNLSYIILSVGVRLGAGNSVLDDEGKCSVEKQWTIIAQGQRMKSLYILQKISKSAKSSNQRELDHRKSLWGVRPAHVHVKSICFMIRKGTIEGIKADVCRLLEFATNLSTEKQWMPQFQC